MSDAESSKAKVLKYAEPLFANLAALLKSDRITVKAQAATAVGASARLFERDFVKFYPIFMPALTEMFKTTVPGDEQGSIRAKAIEAISLIAVAIGKDHFAPAVPGFLGSVIGVLKDTPPTSQLYPFAIQATGRLCDALGPDFVPYLPQIVPYLLKTLDAWEGPIEHDHEHDESCEENHEPDDALESVLSASDMLWLFAERLKAKYVPFLASSAKSVLRLMEIRSVIATPEAVARLLHCLTQLLRVASQHGQELLRSVRVIMERLDSSL
jgi:hypothetical protein